MSIEPSLFPALAPTLNNEFIYYIRQPQLHI